jgi:hypothetical protein
MPHVVDLSTTGMLTLEVFLPHFLRNDGCVPVFAIPAGATLHRMSVVLFPVEAVSFRLSFCDGCMNTAEHAFLTACRRLPVSTITMPLKIFPALLLAGASSCFMLSIEMVFPCLTIGFKGVTKESVVEVIPVALSKCFLGLGFVFIGPVFRLRPLCLSLS